MGVCWSIDTLGMRSSHCVNEFFRLYLYLPFYSFYSFMKNGKNATPQNLRFYETEMVISRTENQST